MNHPGSQHFEFGPFRICPAERLLRRGEEVIPLPPKAIDTLLVLAANAGRAVEKMEIIQHVWPNTFVEEGGLARNISLLRKTLGDHDGKAYIETIPRRGYRFIAPVTDLAAEPPSKRSIAVLPLTNLSPEPADEYFAAGMTEALISYFMKIEALRVCPRTTSALYKAASKPLREIARELQVDHVVEGSVLQANGRVRITASLIRSADETSLWSATYEKQLEDVIALQSDVARDIAREIRVTLSPPEAEMLRASRAVDPEAYQHYLRGRFFWNQRTRDSLIKARDYFQRAIRRDPTYAPAHAGLADTYALLGSIGYDVMPPHEAMPLARQSATTALETDSSLAEAHSALGLLKLVYDWDWQGAEQEFLTASALNPGYAAPWHWQGELFLSKAQPEQAMQAFQRAIELDPISTPGNLGLGWSYYFSRRFEQAVPQFERTLEIAPNLPMALYGLGLTYFHLRQELMGIDLFRRADLSTGGDAAAIMLLAVTSAFVGNRAESVRHLARLEEASTHIYVPAVYFAFVYAISNDLDHAFSWLDRAYEERSSYLIFLRMQPALHNLRVDPRYFELLRRIGL